MDSDRDVLRSRGWNGLFDQDSLVGVWAGMVIMGDTPSWSQVKAIRAPTNRAMLLTDTPKTWWRLLLPKLVSL